MNSKLFILGTFCPWMGYREPFLGRNWLQGAFARFGNKEMVSCLEGNIRMWTKHLWKSTKIRKVVRSDQIDQIDWFRAPNSLIIGQLDFSIGLLRWMDLSVLLVLLWNWMIFIHLSLSWTMAGEQPILQVNYLHFEDYYFLFVSNICRLLVTPK